MCIVSSASHAVRFQWLQTAPLAAVLACAVLHEGAQVTPLSCLLCWVSVLSRLHVTIICSLQLLLYRGILHRDTQLYSRNRQAGRAAFVHQCTGIAVRIWSAATIHCMMRPTTVLLRLQASLAMKGNGSEPSGTLQAAPLR